ncbi:MAG: transglycosylase SLT domain-containing protein, partial [Muribaculaceae bacterium]|nr:transglycosylase SLT domain-containing protein [Muribaculaceae bacterium]
MTILRKTILLLFCAMATALCATAAPSILTLSDHLSDSTIIYPESFETDTHKMMQNWYLRTYTALDRDVDSRPDVTTSDEEIIKRLQTIPTTIELPFNSVVRNYIDMYTGRKRSLVESMLGMSLYYMPIFEEALEREGLPNELKYLPIIESALNPDAVSRVGATGLWQIMLPTARGLGLEVNTLLDERRDPVRSSEAATKYLRQLHDIYKDWSLAIAAYNCGPGNVNKALRRAGDEGKDFWSIYPYLPAETRGYVPCFIAATYVMNYYNKHNISPALAKKPIITDSIHINKRVHFNQIADVLHIPVEELQILNPQYRKQIIPGDVAPCPLVLPATQTCSYIISEDAILAHDSSKYTRRNVVEPATGMEPRPDTVNGQEGEWVTVEVVKYHKVRRNETMASIAKKHGVTLKNLKRANGNISKPKRGQTLKVPTTKREFRPFETTPPEGDDLLVRNPEPADATETATPEGDYSSAATDDMEDAVG